MRSITIFVIVLLHKCSMNERYEMPNVLGGEDYVDVTDLVIKKGYRPIYCGPQKTICALINPNPKQLQQSHELQLKKKFKNWVEENIPEIDSECLNETSIINHSIYQYSYLITYYPIDVYKTEVKIGNDTVKAFFRMDKKGIMFPYDDDGWVFF